MIRVVLTLLLLCPSAFALPHGGASSGAVPVVTAASPNAGSSAAGLAKTSQAIATLTATNTPTSWAIASCSGCTGYFAVDSSGHLTVTSTGASSIAPTDTGATYTPVVNATNGAGTSSNQNIAVTFYDDGSLDGSTGTSAQYATLLNGYTARPAWQVAGVDYGVGVPTGQSLTSVASASISGCTYNSGAKTYTCTGSSVVIDSLDFTVNNGIQLLLSSCTSCIVSNSKFGGSNYPALSTAPLIESGSTTGTTYKYNTIDGGGAAGQCAGTQALLIWLSSASGTSTIEYNWFKNFPSEVVGINKGGSSQVYHYNFIDEGYTESPGGVDAHLNYLQIVNNTGTTFAPTVKFNASRQSQLNNGGSGSCTGVNAGQGFQLYDNIASHSVVNPVLNNNVMIAKLYLSAVTISAMIQGPAPGTSVTGACNILNNYFDVTGATTTYYSTSTSVCTKTGNINMSTGASDN